MRITEAVKHLLIINVIFFIATKLLGDNLYNLFALWFPENPNFRYWQIISYMFMHGGLAHIFLNMYALWMFGSLLENIWGRNKFLFFYFSSGIGAVLLHTLVNYYRFEQVLEQLNHAGVSTESVLSLLKEGQFNPSWKMLLSNPSDLDGFLSAFVTPAVGASGAIYGLMVAFAMIFPNAEMFLMFIPIPIRAKYLIMSIIAIDMFSGLTGKSIMGENIAHFAHLGGALFGFIMVWYWKRKDINRRRWDR